jgi:hypothetical protein
VISIRRVSLGGGYRYLIELRRGRRREPGTIQGTRALLRLHWHPARRLLGQPGWPTSTAVARDRSRHPGERGAPLQHARQACCDPVSRASPLGSRPRAPCRETLPPSPASTSLFQLSSKSHLDGMWALADDDTRKPSSRTATASDDRLRPLLRRVATSFCSRSGAERHRLRGRHRCRRGLLHPLHEPG